MTAFLTLFMQYLPALIQAGTEGYAYVQKVRELAQQVQIWTSDQEYAFTQELENLKTNPPDWWKPES